MTIMNFSFGTNLASKLTAGNGVYVYATEFDQNGNFLATAKLVDNGTVATSPQLSLVPGQGLNVVLTFQETAGTTIAEYVPNAPVTFGQLAFASTAQTNNYRYDTIELTLQNGPSDAADLTNITQFGMPLSLSTPTDTRGYMGTPGIGNTIVNAINGLSPAGFQNGTWLSGSSPLSSPADQRETYMAGNNGNGTSPTNQLNVAADWNNYISGFSQSLDTVRMANLFTGVKNQAGTEFTTPPYFLYYKVAFNAGTNQLSLVPIAGASTTNTFDAYFSKHGLNLQTIDQSLVWTATGSDPNALSANIYVQTGQLSIYNGSTTTQQPYGTNNQFAQPAKFMISGFEAGFWGGSALSVPDAKLQGIITSPTRLDLNQSWNWSTLDAYGAPSSLIGVDLKYSNAIQQSQTGASGKLQYFDPFTSVIFQNSNAYGWSYSDFLSTFQGATNPTLNVYDSTTHADVANISVTLFDLTDTPTGYKPAPLSQFYLPPGTGTLTNSGANSGLQLLVDTSVGLFDSSGNTYNAAPVADAPITFRIFDPGTNKLLSFDLQAATKAAGLTGYAYYYDFNLVGGVWTLTAETNQQSPGAFLFKGLPVLPSGNNWYQVVIGSGSTAKTFNIYTAQTGQTFTQVASDGGSSGQIINTNPPTSPVANNEVKVVLSTGGNITYDPEYWLTSTPGSVSSTPTPPLLGSSPDQKLGAPLIGDNIAGTFIPLSAASLLKQGDLAFSSDAAGDNTTGSFNNAKILLTDSLHPTWILTPVATQADIEGDWMTIMSAQFGDGSYSGYMQQYKAGNWGLDAPVGLATKPVAFTVALDKLPFTATAAGDALQVTQGAFATKGNWIELAAVSSTLPNGTLVAFATDAAGRMLTRDTNLVTTSLEDAALGRIGSVASDNKAITFFSGTQQIYLADGEKLKFAVVTGDGTVDLTPTISVTPGVGGSFNVQVSDSAGTFKLTASENNALDAESTLAASQRVSDHPWFYLKQGTQVQVDLAWSGDYVNTLHFVRMDMNPADPTQLRVGGVDYGNTDAFRAAVASHWEFTSTQGHSTGTASTTWTVAGVDGYYAPVLVSGTGDIWVINQTPTSTANVDGEEHVRNFGENTFGFEDMNARAGADFDYNDMVLKIWPH